MTPIIEQDNYIFVKNKKSIKEILTLFNKSKYGSNSDIYNYKLGLLLKIFKKAENKSKINLYELIKNIETTSIVKPEKYLFINNTFNGYSMKKVDGVMIVDINPLINFNDFINSLLDIEIDIKKLSSNNIVTLDINYLNIIYNIQNNKSYLIDIDSYFLGKNSIDSITVANLVEFYSSIFHAIAFGIYNNFNTESKLYKYILSYITTQVYPDSTLCEHFKYIKNICEDESNSEINTIGDFRKVLKR